MDAKNGLAGSVEFQPRIGQAFGGHGRLPPVYGQHGLADHASAMHGTARHEDTRGMVKTRDYLSKGTVQPPCRRLGTESVGGATHSARR